MLTDSAANYSRAYTRNGVQSVCNIGCGVPLKTRGAYNPSCSQNMCPQTRCANGGVSQREYFTHNRNRSFTTNLAPATDCTPANPNDYNTYLPVEQGANGVTLGTSVNSGMPYCDIQDATVNPVQVGPSVIGYSALANTYTYFHNNPLRLYDTDALTNRGNKLPSFNRQYAKNGYSQFDANAMKFSQACN